MPETSRRDELLFDPASTLASAELTDEFVAEHTALMQKFAPLAESIASGKIDPATVALSVLKEQVRLLDHPKAKPTS